MFSKMIFGESLPTWALFFELALASAVVIATGSRLSRVADALATKLNIGSGWIGLILLATVTSLPEVISGGTATWIGNVDLALGGILGSCSFNITILVLLNVLMGGGSLLRGVRASHTLSSSFGLLLLGLAMMGMVVMGKLHNAPRAAQVFEMVWVGSILITYLGCMRLCFQFEGKMPAEASEASTRPSGTGHYRQVALLSGIIVATSWWLAQIADTLCTHEIGLLGRPLGATFVGAGFLAFATSLPEISTSVAAVRLGNLDLALGNIFGSNMFNIFVIPMLKAVSLVRGDALLIAPGIVDTQQNLIAGLLAILLTTIAVGGLTYQSTRKVFRRLGFDSVLIAIVYVGGMILLLMD